jgi:hypothetical protein
MARFLFFSFDYTYEGNFRANVSKIRNLQY